MRWERNPGCLRGCRSRRIIFCWKSNKGEELCSLLFLLAKINFISAGSVSFNYALNGDELTVEEGSTAIPEFAFRQNNLFLTVVLPTTLETIGRFAFDETSLTEVSL
ncbi:MAG TPA: hypothetical protein DG814_00460, partial [Synechococcus sp. UBA9887]|nr:hypothetical protein [Synechococcus sp. UBA9887]